MASLNVLIWNFYKVTQSNHEKVPSFAMRLEGTFNQIRLHCPGRIMDCEVQQHLKDHLFHGVHNHIRDSIQYLYSNPRTTYSQLMIAAHKVESKNKEPHNKVGARSTLTTKPVEGTTKLGNQIAKLMAALTRAGQSNNPGSAPNNPRHRGNGRGWMDRNTPGHPSSHNGQTGLGQTTSAHSVSAGCSTGTTSQSQGNVQGSKDSQGITSNRKDTSSLQCSRWQGWGHMALECATPAKILNQSSENWGNVAQPPPAPAATAISRPPAFPLWPQTKNWPYSKWHKRKDDQRSPLSLFSILTLSLILVGCSNEAPVIVDGQEMTALIDLGTQVSGASSQFCKELALQTQPLDQLLEIKGMGGAAIPYLGFIKVNLQIPGIKNYNEDVLLLVIPTPTYSETVPVVIGSEIIDRALSLMTKGELAKVTMTWRQAHFGAVMSGSL